MKVFYSKVDSFFIKWITIIIALLAFFTLLPVAFERSPDLSLIITLVVFFLVMVVFILWTVLSIEYRFYDDYLFVKGGPFRSRVVYEDISKVSPTTEVLGGYGILSARNSIEIFYSKSMLGSVKISPHEQEDFLLELEKRCANINESIS